MSDSLWDWTLARARDATASASPTPGGGSVAAISGTFGLSLIVMALEISKKKAGSAELEALLVEARALLERLSEHADRDVQVFEAYMRALRLPKASESEQTERRAALRAATKVATEAPLMAAEDHLRALVLAARASGSIESNVRSDLYAGADLLLGATKASLRSVDINLPNLDDETLHAEVSARARALAQQTDALHAEILSSAK